MWNCPSVLPRANILISPASSIQQTIEAYRAARALCKDVGIVNRVLRLFEALAVADEKGILAEVRKAAAGEK